MVANKTTGFSHIQLSNLHYSGDKIGTDWQIILCFPNTEIIPIRIKESIRYSDNPLNYMIGELSSLDSTNGILSTVITAVEVDRASELATKTGEIDISGGPEQTISVKVIGREIDNRHIADFTFFFHIEGNKETTHFPQFSELPEEKGQSSAFSLKPVF